MSEKCAIRENFSENETMALSFKTYNRVSKKTTLSRKVGDICFEVRIRMVMSYHRMAHYVLIRCFLQPSLAEALCIYTSLVSGIDRTSPTCECGVGYCVTAWRTSCLYGVSHSRKSPTFFYSFGSRTNNGLGSNRGSANTWRSASRDSSDSDASPIVIPAAVSALCISSSAISGVLLS